MSLISVTVVALATLLCGWGLSLVARLIILRVANQNTTSRNFSSNSTNLSTPTPLSRFRQSIFSCVAIVSICTGAALFVYRTTLDSWAQPFLPGDIMAGGASGLLLALALCLGAVGFTFDKSRGRKRCPKCWYDMTGTTNLKCSECGHQSSTETNLHRTRRSVNLITLALIAAFLAIVPVTARMYHRGGFLAITPTWVLVRFVDKVPATWIDGPGSAAFPDEGPLSSRFQYFSNNRRIAIVRTIGSDAIRTVDVVAFARRLEVYDSLDSLIDIDDDDILNSFRAINKQLKTKSDAYADNILHQWDTSGSIASQTSSIDSMRSLLGTRAIRHRLSEPSLDAIRRKVRETILNGSESLILALQELPQHLMERNKSARSTPEVTSLFRVLQNPSLSMQDREFAMRMLYEGWRDNPNIPEPSIIESLRSFSLPERRELVVTFKYQGIWNAHELIAAKDELELHSLFSEIDALQSSLGPRDSIGDEQLKSLCTRLETGKTSVQDALDIARIFRWTTASLNTSAITAATSQDISARVAAARYLLTTMMEEKEQAAMKLLVTDQELPKTLREQLKTALHIE